MPMTLEERIKNLILDRYGDVKTFAIKSQIPNSTLSSMFQRGIFNSTIGRVIQLTSALNISIDSLVDGQITPKNTKETTTSYYSDDLSELINIYRTLNVDGQDFLMKQARLISKSDEYTKKDEQSKNA